MAGSDRSRGRTARLHGWVIMIQSTYTDMTGLIMSSRASLWETRGEMGVYEDAEYVEKFEFCEECGLGSEERDGCP